MFKTEGQVNLKIKRYRVDVRWTGQHPQEKLREFTNPEVSKWPSTRVENHPL